jgi:hypothetical protein
VKFSVGDQFDQPEHGLYLPRRAAVWLVFDLPL